MARKPTLILVDDDPLMLKMLERMLSKADMQVIPLPSVAACLEVLDAVSHDVILTDHHMPDMSGLELIDRVRALPEHADTPVLLVTTEDSNDVLREAFARGAHDFIRKPVAEAELVARVHAAVRFRREHDKRLEREHELRVSLNHLRRDLEAAGRLQRSLLPRNNLLIGGLEVVWHFRPCDDVGGDVLNYFPLNPRDTAIYLIDVAGHGVSSALFAMAVNTMLLANNLPGGMLVDEAGKPVPPGDVLTQLNAQFLMDLEDNKYFTMAYAVYSSDTGVLRYAQGGHPYPIGWRGEQVEEWEEGGAPVGMLPGQTFETYERELKPGDRLVLYSDGITEAFGAGGELFGYERLRQIVADSHELPLRDATTGVLDAVDRWMLGMPPRDDITLLALEVAASSETSQITLMATLDTVRELAHEVSAIAQRAGGDESLAMQVELAVTEAATNIVKHGYRGDIGLITMEVEATGNARLRVTLIDGAPAFNPIGAHRALHQWDTSHATETSAALGLTLVNEIMDELGYERSNEQNRFTMIKHLGPGARPL